MATIQSVERAFQILRRLSGGTAGVTDLAERTGLPKSTVARMLATLVEIGAAEQVDGSSEYRVGPLLGELALEVDPSVSLFDAARPHLTELVDQIGETAGLSVLVGTDVLYLDQIATDAAVQVRDWRGERVSAHLVSSGHVLLAGALRSDDGDVGPEELSEIDFDTPTARSLATADALALRLGEVTKRGVAWTEGELLDDLTSVAAPVIDDGQVVAAVHVHGPSYRFPGERERTVIDELLIDSARRISDQLTAARRH